MFKINDKVWVKNDLTTNWHPAIFVVMGSSKEYPYFVADELPNGNRTFGIAMWQHCMPREETNFAIHDQRPPGLYEGVRLDQADGWSEENSQESAGPA